MWTYADECDEEVVLTFFLHAHSCDQAVPTHTTDGDEFEFLTFGNGKQDIGLLMWYLFSRQKK